MKKAEKQTRQPRAKVSAKKQTQQKEETQESFPGYPPYPASEDIMNRANRIDVDITTAIENNQPLRDSPQPADKPNLGTSKADSDLTSDDFQALASDEIESAGDDEVLANRVYPVDFTGADLDVPGSEDDDAQEEIGSEDEENNSYSIGGDRHEDLEEDRS
jgi:hypothetical protein